MMVNWVSCSLYTAKLFSELLMARTKSACKFDKNEIKMSFLMLLGSANLPSHVLKAPLYYSSGLDVDSSVTV